nr:hypothetical protein BAR15_10053 [Bartonella sp. AR 15-3]
MVFYEKIMLEIKDIKTIKLFEKIFRYLVNWDLQLLIVLWRI